MHADELRADTESPIYKSFLRATWLPLIYSSMLELAGSNSLERIATFSGILRAW